MLNYNPDIPFFQLKKHVHLFVYLSLTLRLNTALFNPFFFRYFASSFAFIHEYNMQYGYLVCAHVFKTWPRNETEKYYVYATPPFLVLHCGNSECTNVDRKIDKDNLRVFNTMHFVLYHYSPIKKNPMTSGYWSSAQVLERGGVQITWSYRLVEQFIFAWVINNDKVIKVILIAPFLGLYGD